MSRSPSTLLETAGSPPLGVAAAAQTFGVYRTVRALGEGASGRVFLAERMDFPQRVALKVFHSGFVASGAPDPENQPTGPAEPHLLASLDHRHIVRVLQQGVTPARVRYLAMEYVDGSDIVSFANTHRLPLPGRLRLLLQVLDAVEHAHRHLVLHGDLKPANILVALGEPAAGLPVTSPSLVTVAASHTGPQVKLVDFGASARLRRRDGKADTTTAHTPAFASPEQRAGERTAVASDIYSLGLLARLLLAGIPPRLRAAESPSRTVKRLAALPEAALPPGQTTDQIAADRATTAAHLAAALRGDLDAILLKALAESPDARYLTADAMAADLRAVAEGRPAAVRRPSPVERLRKWTLRHKLGAAMAAVLLAVLLFSAAGIAVKAAQARRSRRVAETRLRELVALTGTLQSELYGSVRALPGAGDSEKLLTDSAASTLDKLAAAGSQDPTLRAELAVQYEQLARLEIEQASSDPAAGTRTVPAAALTHLWRALELTPSGDPRHAQRAAALVSATNADSPRE